MNVFFICEDGPPVPPKTCADCMYIWNDAPQSCDITLHGIDGPLGAITTLHGDGAGQVSLYNNVRNIPNGARLAIYDQMRDIKRALDNIDAYKNFFKEHARCTTHGDNIKIYVRGYPAHDRVQRLLTKRYTRRYFNGRNHWTPALDFTRTISHLWTP